VTLEDPDLVIWFGNNFAKGKMQEMKRHQMRAKRIIGASLGKSSRKRTGRPSRRATHKEGGYGFLKIIDASERVLGSSPIFNFPIISPREEHFIVEVRLPAGTKVLAQ
jgi:hypothetical protein